MENEIASFGGKTLTREKETSSFENDLAAPFMEMVGQRVREARSRKNISRKALSDISGVSQRYLAQLETGSGNISIVLLRRVADALDYKIEWLVGEEDPYHSEIIPILSLLQQSTKEQRNRVLEILDPDHPAIKRSRRIAFIGLRGAGKSTLGRMSAEEIGVPFLELNEEIEQASGMPVNEVIALYGQEGYRRLEKQSVERIAATHDSIVLAVAGGIVSEPETFNYLLRHYHTIWLKADPDDHMSRVRGQGDERPMAGNPEAMDELKSILMSREALYARAEMTVNTSGRDVGQALSDILSVMRECGLIEI
ncbi:helix-turn-helix transcriptional regulator [Sneathiella aquimaris]|uniref:helix-turn-helix transcriptional regulator n=1 Tax=Sneathiella aquimaris TaxID=2599305 RepID=UPI00146C13B3|nr:helix-turn-helix transcriptional regulator [Sneathiella aquimaris]